jgi:hypothetical protein
MTSEKTSRFNTPTFITFAAWFPYLQFIVVVKDQHGRRNRVWTDGIGQRLSGDEYVSWRVRADRLACLPAVYHRPDSTMHLVYRRSRYNVEPARNLEPSRACLALFYLTACESLTTWVPVPSFVVRGRMGDVQIVEQIIRFMVRWIQGRGSGAA